MPPHSTAPLRKAILGRHHGFGDNTLAELVSDEIVIRSPQQALDLMMDCAYQGATSIIIHEYNLAPEFFDLKTGLAGAVLQKFVNYNIQVAIVGDFTNITSKSLNAFKFESNRGNQIFFLESLDLAIQKLSMIL